MIVKSFPINLCNYLENAPRPEPALMLEPCQMYASFSLHGLMDDMSIASAFLAIGGWEELISLLVLMGREVEVGRGIGVMSLSLLEEKPQ